MDDLVFASDSFRVLFLKLVHSILFLVHVFDQTSSSVSHLTQTIWKSPLHLILTRVCFLAIRFLIRHMPHIMSYKLFHSTSLILFEEVFLNLVERLGKTRHILNQDVVSCNHDFRLFLIRLRIWCCLRCWLELFARMLCFDRLWSWISKLFAHLWWVFSRPGCISLLQAW